MSKKAKKVFRKLSQVRARRDDINVDDDWLSENIKNTVAGGAGALTGTTATFPLDAWATAEQSKNFNASDVNTKDFVNTLRGKGSGAKNQKNLFGNSGRLDRAKTVGKKLMKKNFSGLGPKLMKTIPAMGITFGTVSAAKNVLDEIDKKN